MAAANAPNADPARFAVDELGRARGQRRQDPLRAGLVAAVSAVGAVTFWSADQIETWSCETSRGAVQCAGTMQTFTLGWVWVAAALIAGGVPFWMRYRRGTWRPSAGLVVALAVVVVVVLSTLLPLVSILHPVVYPTATAAAIATLAARRRDGTVLALSILAAAGLLYIEFRVDAAALLEHNLGLAGSALAIAAVAALAAATWRVRDHAG